ncbi:signal peptidase I, partial [Pseudomonadota bacterium]
LQVHLQFPSTLVVQMVVEGDYIFVSKFTYGYSKYSFPFGIIDFKGRLFQKNRLERGDIIVFRYPQNPRINYIKRLVGLPGDKIQMIDGILYINDKIAKKEYKGSYKLPTTMHLDIVTTMDSIDKYAETLPNGKTYDILDSRFKIEMDNTDIFIVPAKHYFFLGDNRDNSQDSRFLDLTGFVPEENIVGKAQIIFLSSSKPIWHFWSFYSMFRWNRFFKKV